MKNKILASITLISQFCLAPLTFAARPVNVAQMITETEKSLAKVSTDFKQSGPLSVYFVKRIVGGKDQSRLIVVTQPVVTTEYQALALGLTLSLADGSQQIGLMNESRTPRGELFVSPASNNATLCISRKLSEQGEAATQAAIQSTTERLSREFPNFEFGVLKMLNIVTVTAPEKTPMAEKIRFLRALAQPDTIEDFSRIGFNAMDGFVLPGDRYYPAVEIQSRSVIDMDQF
jgi:hypothetical protein